MGRKKAGDGKRGKPTAPATVSSKPVRPRNLDHLKNKKMHGLEFGLTQRNNVLIDCYAADRVPREVILDCFEKAGIYPPEASASLVSQQQSSYRTSHRIAKVDAGKELQRIANDRSLSTDQIIIQCSQVVEDVMELSMYDQTPAEDLCPKKRDKKKKHKKVERTAGQVAPTSDSDDSPSPSRPAYANVIGNFSPGALREVSDSFVREREEWSKVRLFVCDVAGCSFGLKGAPSRFSAEGYLRSHLQLKHGVALEPMAAALVKDLKRRQQQSAVAKDCESPASHISAAEDVDRDSSSIHRVRLPMHECMKKTDGGDVCGHPLSNEFELHQHYWLAHPESFFNGFLTRNCETGVVWGDGLDNQVPDPMYVERVLIMRRWLGLDLRKIDSDLADACWQHVGNDADNHGGQPNYERVEHALMRSGYSPPIDEVDAYDLADSSGAPSASPPKRKKKKRTCSLCKQTGHDRRNCSKVSSASSPIVSTSSPMLSPIFASSPPMTPTKYSLSQSPEGEWASPETAAASSPTALVATPSQKRTCSVQ